MNAFYEVHASPFFTKVLCPKHHDYMKELRNGIFGETLWWCAKCERPYFLKPHAMKIGTFDRDVIDKQLAKEQS